MVCGLIEFIESHIDRDRGALEFVEDIIAAPCFRVDFFDFVQMSGEADSALFKVFEFVADVDDRALDESDGVGEFIASFGLGADELVFSDFEFFQFLFFSSDFFELETVAFEFFFGEAEFRLVVVWSASRQSLGHFHLSVFDSELLRVFLHRGHKGEEVI